MVTDQQKNWLLTTLDMLKKTTQDIETMQMQKEKEKYLLTRKLNSIETRYDKLSQPLWSTKRAMLDSIESMIGGRKAMRMFLADNPELSGLFKEANGNFRYKRYFFVEKENEENTVQDNTEKPDTDKSS